MAFTDRYVTVAGAGAHDGTSEANAWTFAEMITGLAGTSAGIRVNMKAGSYSSGTVTMPATPTVSAPFWLRGYSSTIGDLDDQGRNTDGTLDTTGFPVLTLTGVIGMRNYVNIQNLSITGSLASHLIGPSTIDLFMLTSCSVTNSANNAAAQCVLADNGVSLINCDFYCSGASHGAVVVLDIAAVIDNCRFRSTASAALLSADSGSARRSVFWGNSSSVGIVVKTSPSATQPPTRIVGNTFYGIGTAITFPNSAPSTIPIVGNNHVTDCGAYLNNLYSATANIAVIESHNRLRDVTTLRTGIESMMFGEVTTDTGGAETDYENAAGGDFRLISGAPGRAMGIPTNTDAGAYQHADSGGGILRHPGMTGGIVA